jgi:hypothetical protein
MNDAYYRICLRPIPGNLSYRGLQRLAPVPRESEPIDNAFNSACLEYLNQGDRLASHQVACQLFQAICESTQDYELIRVHVCAAPIDEPKCFLGYDICQDYWNSLLGWDWRNGPTWQSLQSNLILMRLIFDAFDPQLNSNRMFTDYIVAERFVKAVHALSILYPGTWESPGHEDYDIVAIYSVKKNKEAENKEDIARFQ